MNINKNFNLPLKKESATAGLLYYYRREVASRSKNFITSEELLSQIEDIAEYLVNEKEKFCLFIMGECGNGKTVVANSIKNLINYLIQNKRMETVDCDNAKYAKVIDAIDMVKAYPESNVFATIKERRFLIIDDLGEEPSEISLYGTIFKPFAELMKYRYREMLPTIICTNLNAQDIKNKYNDDRLIDRMREICKKIVFKGKSYR